ncbi:MAG: glycoside hydrolase family 88 protein [Archangium sp.]
MMGKAREKSFPWLLVGCLCVLAAAPARAFDEAAANRALQFAQQQLRNTANSGIATTQYPKATTTTTGPWRTVPNTDRIDWVQGFFPGQLWYMYDSQRTDSFWRTKADAWTRSLELQKSTPDITQVTHDLGFKFMTSYGQAYRLTGDDYYRQVMITAARTLTRRYNATVGVIDCCDWNDAVWHVPVFIDTMMDLELLFWTARNGGDAAWNDMALSHALKTAADLVRPDGSTYHIVDYSPSGTILSRGTFQGYSDTSTWSRGQAWAVYGFTMAYRYTRDARMLQTAQKVADWYVGHLPSDFVPLWDFNAPAGQQEKDSSAAAAAASGLLELSTYVSDPAVAQRYRNAALSTLDSLSSPAYLASGTSSPSILLHGTAYHANKFKAVGEDVDKGIIYGDYYFVEALLRFKQSLVPGWLSSLSWPGSLHDLGAGHTGVQLIDFDVTPLSKPIDGVIGYAASAATVTSYSNLAMSIRMNDQGFFDVRRGGDYGALASVPYQANATYHVRLRADLNAKTYSVWVTPPGGSEVQLAKDFPFRSDAPAPSDVGKVSLKSGHFENEFRVQNHTVKSEGPPTTVWLSSLDWNKGLHDLGPNNTGVQLVDFDVTPLSKPIDGVIGYADSSTPVTSYSSLAMSIRMNNQGFFDVRRGGDYGAIASVPYQANTTYHVRLRANLSDKTYSVWITPPGSGEVQVASNAPFRSDAPPTDDLGKVSLKSGVNETEFQVQNHTVRPEGPGTPLEDPTAPGVIPEPPPKEDTGCAAAPGASVAAAGLLMWLLRPSRRRPRGRQ